MQYWYFLCSKLSIVPSFVLITAGRALGQVTTYMFWFFFCQLVVWTSVCFCSPNLFTHRSWCYDTRRLSQMSVVTFSDVFFFLFFFTYIYIYIFTTMLFWQDFQAASTWIVEAIRWDFKKVQALTLAPLGCPPPPLTLFFCVPALCSEQQAPASQRRRWAAGPLRRRAFSTSLTVCCCM